MQTVATDALPQVVRDHVASYRNHDIEAFMATLTPDALINDARREFVGAEAIRAWAGKEIFADNVVLDVDGAFEHCGGVILRCRVDGDFDKSKLPDPLILTFHFNLERGLIGQLIIVHNTTNAL